MLTKNRNGSRERQALAFVRNAYQQYPAAAPFDKLDGTIVEDCLTTQMLGDGTCLVSGTLELCGQGANTGTWELTAVCVRKRRKWMLRHAQLAPAISGEEQTDGTDMLLSSMPAGVCLCLAAERLPILRSNAAFLELIGHTAQTLRTQLDNCLAEAVAPSCRAEMEQSLRAQLTLGNTVCWECRLRRADGEERYVMHRARLLALPDGRQALCCVLLDVTETAQARRALLQSLERHRIVMNQTMDIIFEWDLMSDTMLFSPNWNKKLGDRAEDRAMDKQTLTARVAAEDQAVLRRLLDNVAAGAPYAESELRLCVAGGQMLWCRVRLTTCYDETGRPVRAVGAIIDIDAEKRQKQSLMEQARRDGLTGLLNKEAARREVEWRLGGNQQGGVLLVIDLDNFKRINDCCGHLCGDMVIVEVAGVLTRLFRSSDVIARIGGDEFLVFLLGMTRADAERKACELVKRLRTLSVKNLRGGVTCSVGAAVCPQDAKTFRELYHCADIALYDAKHVGKNGVCCYCHDLEIKAVE